MTSVAMAHAACDACLDSRCANTTEPVCSKSRITADSNSYAFVHTHTLTEWPNLLTQPLDLPQVGMDQA